MDKSDCMETAIDLLNRVREVNKIKFIQEILLETEATEIVLEAAKKRLKVVNELPLGCFNAKNTDNDYLSTKGERIFSNLMNK